MNKEEIEASITFNQTKMQEAAKNLDFVLAAQYRDEMIKLEDYLKSLSQ
jgi:excinuclease ABC subunit B